jgi:hypothetical protein
MYRIIDPLLNLKDRLVLTVTEKRRVRIMMILTIGVGLIYIGDYLIWGFTGLVADTSPSGRYVNYVGFVLPMALAIVALTVGILLCTMALVAGYQEVRKAWRRHTNHFDQRVRAHG